MTERAAITKLGFRSKCTLYTTPHSDILNSHGDPKVSKKDQISQVELGGNVYQVMHKISGIFPMQP